MSRPSRMVLPHVLTALLAAGCAAGGQDQGAEPDAAAAGSDPQAASTGPMASAEPTEVALPGTLTLTSPDLSADGYLPAWATGSFRGFCDGENTSPELAWSGAPEGTEGYLLLMVDALEPGFVHWVVSGIPGDVAGLERAPQGQVAVGVVGSSLDGSGSYIGPCGADRQYRYELHALDENITGRVGSTMSTMLAEVDGHLLDSAELVVAPGVGP